ncbi:protein of unknown function [Streptomyces murinus]
MTSSLRRRINQELVPKACDVSGRIHTKQNRYRRQTDPPRRPARPPARPPVTGEPGRPDRTQHILLDADGTLTDAVSNQRPRERTTTAPDSARQPLTTRPSHPDPTGAPRPEPRHRHRDSNLTPRHLAHFHQLPCLKRIAKSSTMTP